MAAILTLNNNPKLRSDTMMQIPYPWHHHDMNETEKNQMKLHLSQTKNPLPISHVVFYATVYDNCRRVLQ